jgi:hypothetical protein
VQGVCWASVHCLNRFRERAGVKGTAGEVLRQLEGWMSKARAAELRPGKVLHKILNHGGRVASYYLVGNPRKGCGWILVVEGQTLRTVHRNESGEWRLPSAGKP